MAVKLPIIIEGEAEKEVERLDSIRNQFYS
jgi:hypothetical protein